MSQFAYQINKDFSIVALTERFTEGVIDVEVDCIMLDNYRGMTGTITVIKDMGKPGQRIAAPINYTGEYGWMDFYIDYGFAIVPNDPTDRSAVIKLINKKEVIL
jgi:hypothetical protein